MDFMNKLRSFLGLPTHNDSTQFDSRRFFEENVPPSVPDIPPRSFDVFTDPLQMAQFFEQQMGEMLKSFGFHDGRNTDDNIFSFFNLPPGIDSGRIEGPESPEDLRDQFLKKGYEIPKSAKENLDKDVDGKINLGELDTVLRKPEKEVVPYKENKPTSFFFGSSSSTRSVMNGDGSVEIHKTVRDNQGNEETTITKKLGDKEYTLIKKKDSSGKEEIIENFVNMKESEKDSLFNKPLVDNKPPQLGSGPYNGFPFDNFFK
ncbi:unnamed protein product [Brassicogethes aeneus]|uniref:EF-hand domain-containing protein n=1 Tax=Brassicogethes aeneus TaxID=1431903 RepID=A0A9P0B4T5_BRAAE|nr:unnamed protein product [Brassicogethes aeneus]